MIYILGGQGFVGSAYARLCAARGLEHVVLTRDNYESLRGTACDVFINANGNSRKFLANHEPLMDFDQSVRSVADSVEAFRAGLYIFLSTGDVYPEQHEPAVTHESQPLNPARQSRYGLHKTMAEMLVRNTQKQWLIVRMGGFVGPGMKKNAIFDLMTGGPVWLSPDSELQFISTDRAAGLVWSMVEEKACNSVVNLGSRGLVRLGTLHEKLKSVSQFQPDAPTVRYELSLERLAALSGEELPDSNEEVLGFLQGAGKL